MAYTEDPLIQPPPETIPSIPGILAWPSIDRSFEVAKKAYEIYFKNFSTLAGISLLVFLPFDLLTFLLTFGDTDELTITLLEVLISLAKTITGFYVISSCISAISTNLTEGRVLTVTEALRAGKKYWGRTAGTSIVVGVICALYSLLLIIPGIIASLRYSLAFILVSLEPDSHPRKRSDELTNGYKWQVFLALAAFGLYTLLAVIPMALFGAISLVSESVSTLLIELYESLLYPLNVVIMVSIYYSLLFKHGKLQVVPIHQEAGQADYIPPPYKPVYTEQATLIGETMPGGDIEPLSDTTPVAESEPGTPNVSASEEAPPR